MNLRRKLLLFACFAAVCASAAKTRAKDAYYRVPLADLKLTEGEFPEDDDYRYDWRTWQRRESMQPRVVLDGDGEAYIELEGNRPRWASPALLRSEGAVTVRATEGQDVAGSLYVPKADYAGMVKLRFSISAPRANSDKAVFYRAKEDHYEHLLGRGVAGAAWYRHQARSARGVLSQGGGEPVDEANRTFRPRPGDALDLLDLFSGGRAIRENLQLDRGLQVAGKSDEQVDIGSIKGITIAEIDWKPLLGDADARLDPLSQAIPADQHAVFFRSFEAAVAMSDELGRQATLFSRLAFSRSEDELTKQRYERQLCLPLSALARLLGPTVIGSVALTGSDPYFFTGTDVAVLFEAKQPAALKTLLLGRAAIAAATQDGAKPVSGETEGLAWSGFLSPDRRVSCLIAVLGDVVVVTNSPAQLAKLAQVKEQKSPAMASLAEYKFFRQRYPRGDAEETAFLFLSDATIRRWCGPRWRIAASRRLRYAAVMSELQARFLDDLVRGQIEAGPIHTDLPLAGITRSEELWTGPLNELLGAGGLRLDEYGVRSASDGTLEYQTPIAELSLDRVTKAEADAYGRWRDRYQSSWRWAFDPIAVRLTVKEDRLAADLTVMPLIWGSDYRQLVEIARGTEIKPASGDPHQTLAHFILAINRESRQLRSTANLAAGLLHVDPLDWLGDWVSLYLDDDAEYWKGLADSKDPDQMQGYALAHLDRLPLGVHLAVRDPLKLTVFLAGLRAWLEQIAPKMTVWESLTYHDEPYVKVSPSERARGNLGAQTGNFSLCYSFSAEGLIISLNEEVLKRAIDRQAQRRQAKQEGKPPEVSPRPWLGSSAGLQFDRKFPGLVGLLAGDNVRQAMQVRSWSNLPILNEWRRRYPDRKPVELHEAFWQTRLVCPGGGQYVWNEQWQTMESTVYGHPGQPKSGPAEPMPWHEFGGGNFGLTFEKHGLRARAQIDRDGNKQSSP